VLSEGRALKITDQANRALIRQVTKRPKIILKEQHRGKKRGFVESFLSFLMF